MENVVTFLVNRRDPRVPVAAPLPGVKQRDRVAVRHKSDPAHGARLGNAHVLQGARGALRQGVAGVRRDLERVPAHELAAVRGWLSAKAMSIYGGSFEIQNNIIAKNILGLPETTQKG